MGKRKCYVFLSAIVMFVIIRKRLYMKRYQPFGQCLIYSLWVYIALELTCKVELYMLEVLLSH